MLVKFETNEDLRDYVLKNLDTVCGLCLSSPPKSMLLDMNVDFKLALLDLYNVLFHFKYDFKVCFTCISSTSKIVEFKAKMRALHGKPPVESVMEDQGAPIVEKPSKYQEKYKECEICGMKRKRLANHKRNFHSDIFKSNLEFKLKCDLCGLKLPTKETMEFHMVMKHTPDPKNKLACKICGQVLQNQNGLSFHIVGTHTKKKPKEVKIAPPFNPIYHENREVTCCGMRMIRLKFQHHKETKHPEQIRKVTPHCKFCLKKFSSLKKLIAHRMEKHKGMEYSKKCEICGKEFRLTFSLLYHKKRHHPELFEEPIEDPFECAICSNHFKTKKLLKFHLYWEHINPGLNENYNPKCVDGVWHCCGQTFERRVNFQNHKSYNHKEHIKYGEIVSFCNICGLRIEGKMGSLRKHKNEVHKNDKNNPKKPIPFKPRKLENGGWRCCGVTFDTSKKFHKHKERVHKDQLGKRVVHCQTCFKKFKNKVELKEHQKKENHKRELKGERTCDLCNLKFQGTKLFYKHKKVWHPELFEEEYEKFQFKCNICTEKFKYKEILVWHMMSEHTKGGKTRINEAIKAKEPRLIDCFWICCGKPFSMKQIKSHCEVVHGGKSDKNKKFEPKMLGENAVMCCGIAMTKKCFSTHKARYHQDQK